MAPTNHAATCLANTFSDTPPAYGRQKSRILMLTGAGAIHSGPAGACGACCAAAGPESADARAAPPCLSPGWLLAAAAKDGARADSWAVASATMLRMVAA